MLGSLSGCRAGSSGGRVQDGTQQAATRMPWSRKQGREEGVPDPAGGYIGRRVAVGAMAMRRCRRLCERQHRQGEADRVFVRFDCGNARMGGQATLPLDRLSPIAARVAKGPVVVGMSLSADNRAFQYEIYHAHAARRRLAFKHFNTTYLVVSIFSHARSRQLTEPR